MRQNGHSGRTRKPAESLAGLLVLRSHIVMPLLSAAARWRPGAVNRQRLDIARGGTGLSDQGTAFALPR